MSDAQRDAFFAEYERLVLQGCGVEVSAEVAGRIWRRLGRVGYALAPFDDSIPTLEALRERGVHGRDDLEHRPAGEPASE